MFSFFALCFHICQLYVVYSTILQYPLSKGLKEINQKTSEDNSAFCHHAHNLEPMFSYFEKLYIPKK